MKLKLKDPGSAITHGIAFLLAAFGAAPLLIRSSEWCSFFCGSGEGSWRNSPLSTSIDVVTRKNLTKIADNVDHYNNVIQITVGYKFTL